MAIDSQTQPQIGSPGDPGSSIIENEIPAYRAISARAVTSMVLGLASVFCFTSLWFLLVTAASVWFGWAALRAIKRMPDVLTGANLAKTGIGLGLVFGLSAVTRTVVENAMITYDAGQFAKKYVEVLKTGTPGEAVWYKQSPEFREEKTVEQAEAELKKTKNPTIPDVYAQETGPIVAIQELLKQPKSEIHYSAIESSLVDGLTHYANALIDIDTPEGEKFALLELVKTPTGKFGDWRIREIIYPYRKASAQAQSDKKPDDGHGHDH